MTSVRIFANIPGKRECPKIQTVLYKDDSDSVPFLEWFDELPSKVQAKCLLRIGRLTELGHELRRPEADYLRDGIYELRIRHQRINYRILYFFHGKVEAVISHGLEKEKAVPSNEIEKAVERRAAFVANPEMHIYEE